MKKSEALQIVEMILSGWPSDKDWTTEGMQGYADGIQDLDARLATKAVARARNEMPRRPPVSVLREYVRIEAKGEQTWRETPTVSLPPPVWVFQWARARSVDDMRLLPQQALAYREMGYETPEVPYTDTSAWVGPDEFLEGPIGLVPSVLTQAMPV